MSDECRSCGCLCSIVHFDAMSKNTDVGYAISNEMHRLAQAEFLAEINQQRD